MQINIEGIDYQYPSSLMDITLQERIGFEEQYGKALSEKLKQIIDIKDETLRDLEYTEYYMELACKTLSYFAKIPLEVVENTNINQVTLIYHRTMTNFSKDVEFTNKEFVLQHEFQWNDCTWVIAPPELSADSEMNFGEFLNAKQAVKDLVELGNSKMSALHALCCVYFRKKHESYQEKFSREGSDRYNLMLSLPLQYALHVGFFLSASLNSWLSTFPFLIQEGEAPAVPNSAPTSTPGNG